MAERAYNGHAKIFGQYCTEIEQALATYGFQPEVLTGQGYINLHYGLMNPVRSFEIEPPKYRADIPILDALDNPDIVETRDNLAATATFAHVETEPNGWTFTTAASRTTSVLCPLWASRFAAHLACSR